MISEIFTALALSVSLALGSVTPLEQPSAFLGLSDNTESVHIVQNGAVYEVQLSDTIGQQQNYYKLIDLLRDAKKGDVINVTMSGYGGFVQTFNVIAYHMKHTKATVNTHVVASVYSAHAFITLLGHNITVEPNTHVMVHLGNILELLDKALKSDDVRMKQMALASYKDIVATMVPIVKDILTKEEFKLFMAGHDVYLEGADIEKRLNKLGK